MEKQDLSIQKMHTEPEEATPLNRGKDQNVYISFWKVVHAARFSLSKSWSRVLRTEVNAAPTEADILQLHKFFFKGSKLQYGN